MKKKGKKVVAFLCALMVVMGSVAEPFLFRHVEAADIEGVTEVVTFADFGIKDDTYGIKIGSSGGVSSYKGNCGKTRLDGVLFHGKVKFSKEAPITISFFGKGNEWMGLRLSSTEEGNLTLKNYLNGGHLGTDTFTPAVAETQLTGAEIDLKMSVQYVDNDGGGVKDDVKLGVWFNDKLYDNKYIYKNGAADYVGSYIGIFGDKSSTNATVAVASVWDLEEMTFADFGVKDDIYKFKWNGGKTGATLTTAGTCRKTSFDGILFHGKVKFSEETPFNISLFGNGNGMRGFKLYSNTDGTLKIDFIKTNGTKLGSSITFNSATAGTTLIGQEIDFKMSIQYADQDGDGVKDDVKLGVWFNDKLYENKLIYLDGAVSNLGNYIGIFGQQDNANANTKATVAVASAWNFEEMTFADFGVKDDIYKFKWNGGKTGATLTTAGTCRKTSFDGILFHGKVKFSEETPFNISLFGNGNGMRGFKLYSNTDGTLKIDFINTNGTKLKSITFNSATAGTTLIGQEIDFKMSIQYADKDGDGIKDDVKLGVWFNDKLYENKLIYVDEAALHLGNNIGIFGQLDNPNANENATVAVQSALDLEEITFAHFDVQDGTYRRHLMSDGSVAMSAEGNCEKTDLDGLLFHGKVKFSEEKPFYISFFGKKNGNQGLRFQHKTDEDGKLFVQFFNSNNVIAWYKKFDSTTAGATLIGQEIDLKISVQYVDKDGDGSKNDVKLGFWFNDKLYDSTFISLDNNVDELGSYIGIFGDRSAQTELPEVVVTSAEENLPDDVKPNKDLKEITFAHYGVKDGEYSTRMNGETLALSTQGTYEETGPDGILFHSKVKFSEAASSTISFFGKDSAWKGLRFSSTEDGKLVLNFYKNDVSAQVQTFSPDVAGTTLIGQEIDFKMSIQYADQDGDGKKDDVKLGVWFNDKLYENKLIYVDEAALHLGNYIGIFGDKKYTGATVEVKSIINIVNFNKDDTPMDVRDLVAMIKYRASTKTYYEWYDLDGDGTWNAEDVTRMRKLLVGSYEILDGHAIVPTFYESNFDKLYNFIGGKDVMPIGGYYGPYLSSRAQFITDETMQLIAEAGVNLITYGNLDYATSSQLVRKSLDLGEKYGVGIFVKDTNITSQAGNASLNITKIKKQVTNYYNHPAFCGLYLVDEPVSPNYKDDSSQQKVSMYGDLANTLQYDLKIPCYSNMLPCTSKDLKTSYRSYVDEFCTTLNPKVIMWDYYVLDPYGNESNYFWNMDLMRTKSKKNGVPFWAFIAAGGRWRPDDTNIGSATYHPTEGEFNWNVNTCLAFGAQGIQYFPLIQPEHFATIASENGDYKASGLIGATGEKNDWYGYAQKINTHIGVIDEVLMNSVHQGVIVNGSSANQNVNGLSSVITSGSFRELQSVSSTLFSSVMVGCFDYNGKTALYVVNYSTTSTKDITLNFTKTCNIKITQNAVNSSQNASQVTLNMTAGEGVLLVIE